jgi:hypothetical protein
MFLLLLGLASSGAWAAATGGIPWQVGDPVVCFGGGQCNVLRIVSGSAVLLDQISDGLGGNTTSVAIDNTLHVVTTDNFNSGSNVVVYTIASINPSTHLPLAHTPLHIYNGSAPSTTNVQAIALNSGGHIFVGNAGAVDAPGIVELDAHGNFLGARLLNQEDSCNVATLASLDVSADGSSVFFTASDGTIRQISVPVTSNSTCGPVIKIFQPGQLSAPTIMASSIRVLPPNSLSGNCLGAPCPAEGGFLVVAKGTVQLDLDGDPEEPVDDADTADICTLLEGPPSTSCALLLDNSGKIVATYLVTVSETTLSTLGALALDPLVTDCTGSGGFACEFSITTVPTVSNFWLGDSASPNFYKLDFATGTPKAFSANVMTNPPCTNPCSMVTGIQGIGIYGGEGANQPDLALLLSPTDITQPPTFSNNTAGVEFLNNKENVTLYFPSTTPNPGPPVALYASAAGPDAAGNESCFDDAGTPCRQTTSTPGVGIVWKIDTPVGGTPGGLAFPAGTIVASKYSTDMLATPQEPIDNGTAIFTDMAFNDTNSVGNNDPSRPSKSVGALIEVPSQFTAGAGTGASGCFYLIPAPNGACFPSGPSLKFFPLIFAFQCKNLTADQFEDMHEAPGPPYLELVQTFSTTTTGPIPAPKPSTTGAVNYTFIPFLDLYEVTLNWESLSVGTYRATTFDPTGTVQPFTTTFTKATSCPSSGKDKF